MLPIYIGVLVSKDSSESRRGSLVNAMPQMFLDITANRLWWGGEIHYFLAVGGGVASRH